MPLPRVQGACRIAIAKKSNWTGLLANKWHFSIIINTTPCAYSSENLIQTLCFCYRSMHTCCELSDYLFSDLNPNSPRSDFDKVRGEKQFFSIAWFHTLRLCPTVSMTMASRLKSNSILTWDASSSTADNISKLISSFWMMPPNRRICFKSFIITGKASGYCTCKTIFLQPSQAAESMLGSKKWKWLS